MKNILIILLVVCVAAISACTAAVSPAYDAAVEEVMLPKPVTEIEVSLDSVSTLIPVSTAPIIEVSFFQLEEAIERFATDIVIARYVGRRLITETLLEIEFVVDEVILGNAEERIVVYTERWVEVWGHEERTHGYPISMEPDVEYLLLLFRSGRSAYTFEHINQDAFRFINDLVIDITRIEERNLEETLLAWELEGLDFARGVTGAELVSYVTSFVDPTVYLEREQQRQSIIDSELMRDIIIGSPNIFIVEINQPVSLMSDVPPSNWMSTDIYHATVLEVLKGDEAIVVAGDSIRAIFFADTVFPDEKHIIAVDRRPGSSSYTFTSRNSLFPLSDLPEILAILNPPQSVTITAEGTGDRLLPGNILQLAAAVYPAVARQDITWAVTGHQQATISEAGLLAVANTTPGGTVLTVTATATDTEVYATLDLTIIVPEDEDGLRWFAGGHHRSGANNEADDETDTTTEQEHRLQLIFTINETIFLLNGDHRTAVGAPFLEGARTMVPLRTIAESTGAGVEWCDDTQSAIIHLYRSELFVEGVHQPTLTIPISDPLPDGMGSVMLINARTFVPLRFIMEAMDADVEWLEETEQAIITWLATGLPAWH